MKIIVYILTLVLSLTTGKACYAQRTGYQQPTTVPCDSTLSVNLLNSERIEMKFGGYGIDVLYNSDRLRVSNLYDEKHVTRTLAITDYPSVIDSSFSNEHQLIIRGASIGSTFKAHGWKIEKKNIFFGEIPPSEHYNTLYGMMGNIPPVKLSVWIYVFYIRKGDKALPYATISEVYHPDYLPLPALMCINKDFDAYLKRTRTVTHELKKIRRLLRLDFEGLAIDQ